MTENLKKKVDKAVDTVKSVFDTLYAVDLTGKIKKKNGFNYASWATVFAQLLAIYPDASWRVVEFDSNGQEIEPDAVQHITRTRVQHLSDGSEVTTTVTEEKKKHGYPYQKMPGIDGAQMKTEMTINGMTRTVTLPILDQYNNGISMQHIMLTDINRTMWRCLVKNAALFGLGLRLYEGEDIGSDEGNRATISKPEEADPKPEEIASEIMNLETGEVTKIEPKKATTNVKSEEKTERKENNKSNKSDVTDDKTVKVSRDTPAHETQEAVTKKQETVVQEAKKAEADSSLRDKKASTNQGMSVNNAFTHIIKSPIIVKDKATQKERAYTGLVGRPMLSIVTESKSEESGLKTLRYYEINGKDGDSEAAATILKQLQAGKLKFNLAPEQHA